MVSIDNGINLNWYTEENCHFAEDFGEIDSEIALLESLVDRIFINDKTNRLAYKKLLGNILARALDDEKTDTSRKILKECESRIVEHSKERVRTAYISYSVASVVLVGIAIIFLMLNRLEIGSFFNKQLLIYQLFLCTLFGGLGAFITTFARFVNYQGNIMSGLPIHRLDGFLRILYGLVAGVFVTLAIKGNVIASFADKSDIWIRYFFSMVASASEILVPNLVKQFENRSTIVDKQNSIN